MVIFQSTVVIIQIMRSKLTFC